MGLIGGRSMLTPTAGSTVTISIDTSYPHTVCSWTAAQAETINLSGTPNDGQLLTLIVTNDASSGRVLTMGTNLKSSGTITGTVNKKATITFIALGGAFYEIGRTLGL